MSRTGGIVFIEEKYGDLETFQTLEFAEGDEKVLITDLWEFRDCFDRGRGRGGVRDHISKDIG